MLEEGGYDSDDSDYNSEDSEEDALSAETRRHTYDDNHKISPRSRRKSKVTLQGTGE